MALSEIAMLRSSFTTPVPPIILRGYFCMIGIRWPFNTWLKGREPFNQRFNHLFRGINIC
jgi:hypothetical protein